MKIKSIFAICAAAVLCACSSEEADTTAKSPAKNTISFNMSSSRAAIAKLDDVKANGFKFNITYGAENYCNEGNAFLSSGLFVTNPVLFWPGEISAEKPCVFTALSCPSQNSISLNLKDGVTSFSYAVQSNSATQEDVLVATASATAIPAGGTQNITFTHALTKVNFSVYVSDNAVNEGYEWRVSSVTIKAKGEGTYTYGAATPWLVADGLKTFEYLNSTDDVKILKGKEWTGANNFMLIPQSDNLEITVAWNVYKNNVLVSQAPAQKTFVRNTADWAPGTSHRYGNHFNGTPDPQDGGEGFRLPDVGEDNGGGVLPGYDDNNMVIITYDPTVTDF